MGPVALRTLRTLTITGSQQRSIYLSKLIHTFDGFHELITFPHFGVLSNSVKNRIRTLRTIYEIYIPMKL